MRVLLLLALMIACLAMGPENPVFLMGAFVLFGWLVIAITAGGLRWLLSLTVPSPGSGREMTGPAARTRVCPDSRCGRINTGQARFCAQCGRRLA